MSGSGFIKAQVDTELTASIDPSGLATQVTLASIDGKLTACNTGAVAGAVTANAGANLNTAELALESGGNLAAIASSVDAILLGTPVYLTVTGVSAETAADIPAGNYILVCTCDVTFRVNAAGGGAAAVWATAPGVVWGSMTPFPFRFTAAQRIAAITSGGATGSLMLLPWT